ncbi:restriction endonuclease [Rhodococcoides fascians A25f]|uniref:restriction endonuclease n=1 Tax=Rhodococcoides fascians TaxID=1828 RepID=UPI0013FDD004|nr:restriction endonuclease [Rhodococcus fascians]QII07856.1 restriction endonuclease [Rhodococcus fascians A25f]
MVEANPEWMNYQLEVSRFFADLGMEALVDQTVQGVRTSHDIDVLVRGSFVGFDITWVVECKAWQSRIPKEKVLALRQIVDDVGADRGFVMAESGYQSGALEAALVSNVTLTSIADLTERLHYDLAMTKLMKLEHRADEARERYWALKKYVRIDAGLRPEVGESGYSGTNIIASVDQALRDIRLRGFPVIVDPVMATLASHGSRYSPGSEAQGTTFSTPEELFKFLDSELSELEARLDRAHQGGSAPPASSPA